MENFSKSKSCRESVVQPTSMNGLRSNSTSAHNPPQNLDHNKFKEMKIKKANKSSRINGNLSKIWGMNMDPDLQRKKRVVAYKAYAMEGKMKSSMKKSFRWIKDTCNQVVHGTW